MIIAPLSLLSAFWLLGCWLVAKLASKIFGGFLGKTISAAKYVWIIPMVIGVLALVKGV